MAVLTDTDYRQIYDMVKDDLKQWDVSKSEWKALFQAAEDWFVNGFQTTPATSFKTALDSIVITTVTQAKWIGKAWFAWRIKQMW